MADLREVGDDVYDLVRQADWDDFDALHRLRGELLGGKYIGAFKPVGELSCRREMKSCVRQGRREHYDFARFQPIEHLRDVEVDLLIGIARAFGVIEDDLFSGSEVDELKACIFDKPGSDCRGAAMALARAYASHQGCRAEDVLCCLDTEVDGDMDVMILVDLAEDIHTVQSGMREKGWRPKRWTLGGMLFEP